MVNKLTQEEITPQYNLCPLCPQVKEQEGEEPPRVVGRRVARRQPHGETRTEHLEQRIDTLTELVNTLVTALGQNAANVAPAIPPGILLANTEGEEVPPLQEGGNAIANKAQTETYARRRRAQCRHHNATQETYENRETTPESHKTERTKDSIFIRLKQKVGDPNLDDKYDSKYECSAGSKETADLRARLDPQRARCEQQPENRLPIQATPEKECLS